MNNICAPYIKTSSRSRSVMADVIIASSPLIVWGCWVFGMRSLMITLISAATASAADYAFTRFIRKKGNSFDCSAVITGLFVAFSMPVSVPLWLPAACSLFAIVVVKQIFGGIGSNIFNPAAASVCAAYMAFPDKMTLFTKPFSYFPSFQMTLDADMLAREKVITSIEQMRNGTVNVSAIGDNFYGMTPGAIGTVSVLLILLAFIFLLSRRTISFSPAFAYVMTITVLTFFTAYADSEPVDFTKMQLFSGAVFFAAVFMINDFTTSPATKAGKLTFAVLSAALCVGIRYFGHIHYAEYFSLVICNMLVPVIEKATYPRVYGSYIRREDK